MLVRRIADPGGRAPVVGLMEPEFTESGSSPHSERPGSFVPNRGIVETFDVTCWPNPCSFIEPVRCSLQCQLRMNGRAVHPGRPTLLGADIAAGSARKPPSSSGRVLVGRAMSSWLSPDSTEVLFVAVFDGVSGATTRTSAEGARREAGRREAGRREAGRREAGRAGVRASSRQEAPCPAEVLVLAVRHGVSGATTSTSGEGRRPGGTISARRLREGRSASRASAYCPGSRPWPAASEPDRRPARRVPGRRRACPCRSGARRPW